MNDDVKVKGLDLFAERVIFLFIGFIIGAILGLIYTNNSTPVERNNVIDSLTAVNDTIKIKVN